MGRCHVKFSLENYAHQEAMYNVSDKLPFYIPKHMYGNKNVTQEMSPKVIASGHICHLQYRWINTNIWKLNVWNLTNPFEYYTISPIKYFILFHRTDPSNESFCAKPLSQPSTERGINGLAHTIGYTVTYADIWSTWSSFSRQHFKCIY